MIKILSIFFTTLFSFNAVAHFTNCEYKGDVTQYLVTMTSAMICQDYNFTTGACTGANDFTVSTNSKTCDIASVPSNNDVCTYGSLAGMQLGETYNYIRVTLKRDFTIKASLTPTASMTDVSGNTNSECTGFTIRTESDNTNGKTSPPHGVSEAVGSTNPPESQVVTFMNGQGNDTSGCTTACIPTAKDTRVTDCDGTRHTSAVDSNYTYDVRYCTPTSALWLGELTNTQNEFTLIYKLSSPYTVGITAPKLQMKFDTADTFNGYYDGKHGGSSENNVSGFSMILPGEPLVAFKLTE